MTRFRGFDDTIKVLRDRLFNLPYVQYCYYLKSSLQFNKHPNRAD